MGILKEFREFAVKGNVVDLAVGIIIGAAFTKIVSSLVQDILMPPLGALTRGIDFKDKFFVLATKADAPGPFLTPKAAQEAGATVMTYGNFIAVTIEFIIVAFAVFMLVKGINTLRRRFEEKPKPAPATPPAPTREEVLLTEIRDALRAR